MSEAALGGIGLALVPVERALRLLGRAGAPERLFTPEERAYAERRPRRGQTLAGRLAAKLAVRAALAQAGLPAPRLRDVAVLPGAGGAPAVALRGERASLAAGDRLELSLAHERELAVASAWLMRAPVRRPATRAAAER